MVSTRLFSCPRFVSPKPTPPLHHQRSQICRCVSVAYRKYRAFQLSHCFRCMMKGEGHDGFFHCDRCTFLFKDIVVWCILYLKLSESCSQIAMLENFLSQNFRAFIIATAIAVGWVEICKYLASNGVLAPWQRRKLLHIVTGPLFISTWPLFTDDARGAQWAAAVPFFMTLKFVLVGMGWLKDDDMILSASRSNQRSELLRGPSLYGVIFIASTILYWKQLPAIVCLFALCFGDGFAEIFGRAYGIRNKIFYSKDKSWAGFVGFVVSSITATMLFLSFFGTYWFGVSWNHSSPLIVLLGRVSFDCIIAAFVETLPLNDIDNLTVFGAAVLADNFISNFLPIL